MLLFYHNFLHLSIRFCMFGFGRITEKQARKKGDFERNLPFFGLSVAFGCVDGGNEDSFYLNASVKNRFIAIISTFN